MSEGINNLPLLQGGKSLFIITSDSRIRSVLCDSTASFPHSTVLHLEEEENKKIELIFSPRMWSWLRRAVGGEKVSRADGRGSGCAHVESCVVSHLSGPLCLAPLWKRCSNPAVNRQLLLPGFLIKMTNEARADEQRPVVLGYATF